MESLLQNLPDTIAKSIGSYERPQNANYTKPNILMILQERQQAIASTCRLEIEELAAKINSPVHHEEISDLPDTTGVFITAGIISSAFFYLPNSQGIIPFDESIFDIEPEFIREKLISPFLKSEALRSLPEVIDYYTALLEQLRLKESPNLGDYEGWYNGWIEDIKGANYWIHNVGHNTLAAQMEVLRNTFQTKREFVSFAKWAYEYGLPRELRAAVGNIDQNSMGLFSRGTAMPSALSYVETINFLAAELYNEDPEDADQDNQGLLGTVKKLVSRKLKEKAAQRKARLITPKNDAEITTAMMIEAQLQGEMSLAELLGDDLFGGDGTERKDTEVESIAGSGATGVFDTDDTEVTENRVGPYIHYVGRHTQRDNNRTTQGDDIYLGSAATTGRLIPSNLDD